MQPIPDMRKRDKINATDETIGRNSSTGTAFPSNETNVTFRTAFENYSYKSYARAGWIFHLHPSDAFNRPFLYGGQISINTRM